MKVLTEITLGLPQWVKALVPDPACSLATVEDRMRFVIQLAGRNVAQGTGEPFAAAVFDMRTTELLSVSVNTVREMCRRIYEKLEVNTKIEAVSEARRRGFLKF